MVVPCVTLLPALYNPQEEDSVPPRPPLPQSYEPNPPVVPPLPSHAGVRPSSLPRPEDRKANHRNSTHSVSLLTPWLIPPSAVPSHVITHCDVFGFYLLGSYPFYFIFPCLMFFLNSFFVLAEALLVYILFLSQLPCSPFLCFTGCRKVIITF